MRHSCALPLMLVPHPISCSGMSADNQQTGARPLSYIEHRLVVSEAEKHLTRSSREVCELCNSEVWVSQVRTMGEDIGHAQQEKCADAGKRNRPVEGDESFLLEATHQVVARQLQDKDNPPFSRACMLIIDMLRALQDIENSTEVMRLPVRTDAYFDVYVTPAVTPVRCYVFLLYATYLRVELPKDAPLIKELNDLLDRYRLFSILAQHPAGINDVFVGFNGRYRFEDRNGRPFENRYHYNRIVQPGDTLKSLIQLYPNWDRTWANRLQSLMDINPAIMNVDPFAELSKLDPPVKSIRMVPPATQVKGYEERIKQFRDRLQSDVNHPPSPGMSQAVVRQESEEQTKCYTLQRVREILVAQTGRETLHIDAIRRRIQKNEKKWGILLTEVDGLQCVSHADTERLVSKYDRTDEGKKEKKEDLKKCPLCHMPAPGGRCSTRSCGLYDGT